MVSGKNAAVGVMGLCVVLAGCVGFSGARSLGDRAAVRSAAPSGPDLRIPADGVASRRADDIPLVPVPPVPPRGDRAQQAVTPVSNLAQDPPPSAPPASHPAGADAPGSSAPTLHDLQKKAADWYAGVDSYIVRLTRREAVNGKSQAQEILLFKFRKQPWSVHFKWLGNEGKDREVLYVKGRFENKLHSRLAAGDVPLMPAGMHVSLALDNPMVKSASRHSITDAGIGASIERLGALIAAQENGDARRGTVTLLGPQNRPEFPQPVQVIEHVIPADVEPELPKGGRRLYCFDPTHHLPLLVIARDDKGQEVEYYLYDRLQTNVRLDDDDFDPEKLWGGRASKGN
jgi:hypothetical protein